MALLRELGFLPLNARDDFNVLYRFFSRQEFTEDYLAEELELAQVFLEPPQEEMIRRLMLERTPRGDLRRAADYFKLVRYSFSGNASAFAGRPCDLRRFFYLVWECSRRLKDVVVENKDFGELIAQYDRADTFFYCDPPYFNAECYEVAFPKTDHIRLHDTLTRCKGLVMVSYNYCPFICDSCPKAWILPAPCEGCGCAGQCRDRTVPSQAGTAAFSRCRIPHIDPGQ